MHLDNRFFVINIDDAAKWNDYIFKSFQHDFYHTHAYHKIEPNLIPFLFVFESGDDFIAIPLLKRPIENTPYFDCTSVYGYTGPISNLDFKDIPECLILAFKGCFLQFLKEQNIVSVFSRIHPIINKNFAAFDVFDLHQTGKTIAIDLQISLDEQRLKYRRAYRQKINQLRNKGYEVKIAETEEELKTFVNIYLAGMEKVGASSAYFFDEQYFQELLTAKDFKCFLLLAYYNNNITAGALLTIADQFMQVHLTGTANEYANDSPMKLLFDEASILARQHQLKYMHIGSGVGGAEDSLFHFKAGFSDLFFDFKSLRIVANQQVYNELTFKRNSTQSVAENLFPAYRF